MKTKDEKQNYLLDFYPSEGANFHCQLTAGSFGERPKQNTRAQASFSQCPNPYSQCPNPYSQCPAPEPKNE